MTVRSVRPLLAVAAIIVAAVWFRFGGLHWDEGTHTHPDERFLSQVAEDIELPDSLHAYLDTSHSPLNPYTRGHPFFVYGTLPLFLAKAVAAAAGMDDFQHLYLVGRTLSATFDSLTVLVTFLLASRLYSRRVAALAAFLVATNVLHIQHAHFFVVESALVLFCTLTLLFAARIATEGRWLDFVFAGLAAGCAVSCKVTALPILGVVAAAGFQSLTVRRQSASFRRLGTLALALLAAVAVAFATFRILQPYAFAASSLVRLNPDFTASLHRLAMSAGDLDYPPALQWYGKPLTFGVRQMVAWGMGVLPGIAALCGLALAAFEYVRTAASRHLVPVLWASFVVVYASIQHVQPMRYFLPAYPVLLILAAYAVVQATERLAASRRRTTSRLSALWPRVPVVAVAGTALLWALAFSHIYRTPFVRAEATRWIANNVPPGSTVAVEEWDDPLPAPVTGRAATPLETLTVPEFHPESPGKRRHLVQILDDADYIFINSCRGYGSIPNLPGRYPFTIAYYQHLFRGELGFALVRSFTSEPSILGLTVNTDVADESFRVYDHPRVLIFAKQSDFDISKVRSLVADAAPQRQLPSGRDLILLARRLSRESPTLSRVAPPHPAVPR